MPHTEGTQHFPTRLGIIGDLGQSYNSSTTVQHLTVSDPPVGAYFSVYNP